MNKASEFEESENYEKAVTYYNKIIKECDEYLEEALSAKGYIYYYHKDNFELANKCYNRIIRINRNPVPLMDAWTYKFFMARDENEIKKAIYFIDKVIELDPTALNSWREKTDFLNIECMWEELLETCNKIFMQIPFYNERKEKVKKIIFTGSTEFNFRFPYEYKLEALFELERYQDVIEFSDKCLMINYKWEYVWQYRIDSLLELKEYKKALRECERAISACKDNDELKVLKNRIEDEIQNY